MNKLINLISSILVLLIISSIISLLACHNSLSKFRGYIECFIKVSYSSGHPNIDLITWQNDYTFNMLDKWTFSKKSNLILKSFRSTAEDVELNSVGLYYNDLMPVRMKMGKFLWNEDINKQKSYIVLDSNLSFKLFGVKDSIGKKIDIDGTTYKVVGICIADNVMNKKSTFKAFIPFNGRFAFNDEIEIMGKSKYFDADIASRKLENHLKQTLPWYEINVENLNSLAILQQQKIMISLFIFTLSFIIIINVILFRFIKRKCAILKKQLKVRYFDQLIHENKRVICFVLVSALLVTVFSICALKVLSFRLYIPPGWIPQNLISIKEYMLIFQQNIITRNSGFAYKSSNMIKLEHLNTIINISLIIFWGGINMAITILCIYKYKTNTITKVSKTKQY